MRKAQEVHTRNKYGFKEGAEEFPLMVVISFVYKCNAKCPNCPYNNSDIREKYREAIIMPENIFKKIADECGRYRAYIRISGGGEPMLHPQVVELVQYAKLQGARIGLITNGSRFHNKNLTALIGVGIDNIEFSADAPDEETYRRVRPGLDWGRLNRNVKMAVEIRNRLKAETRIIVSVIDQENVDIAAAEEYWNNIVDKVQIRKYLTWGYCENKSGDPTPYLPPEERIPCPWLFERLNIDSLGNATICGEDIAFDAKFANIMDRSIRDLWLGTELNHFREKHLSGHGDEILICSKCPDWQYRSWNYNYWKILKDVDGKKKLR
jgi:pyruvate-formate lyase-activating enzyme